MSAGDSYSEQKAEELFLGSECEFEARNSAHCLVNSDTLKHKYVTEANFRAAKEHNLFLMATSENPNIRKAVASNAIEVFKEALRNPRGKRCLYAAKGLRMLSDCNEEMRLAMLDQGVIEDLVIVAKRSVTEAESVDAMGALHHLTRGIDIGVILKILDCGGEQVFLNFMKSRDRGQGHLAYAGLAHLVLNCTNEKKLELARDRGAIDMCVKVFNEDRRDSTGMTAKLNAMECVRNFLCGAKQDVIDILYEKKAIQTLLGIARCGKDLMMLWVAIHGLFYACEDGDDKFKQMLMAKHDLVGIMKFHVLNDHVLNDEHDKAANLAVRVFAGLASGSEYVKRVLLEEGLIECLSARAEDEYKQDNVKFAQAVGVVLFNMSKIENENDVESFLGRGARALAVRTQVYLRRRAAATADTAAGTAATTDYYIVRSKEALSNITLLEESQKEMKNLEARMRMMQP